MGERQGTKNPPAPIDEDSLGFLVVAHPLQVQHGVLRVLLSDLHHSLPRHFVQKLRLVDEYFVFSRHQARHAMVAFLLWK